MPVFTVFKYIVLIPGAADEWNSFGCIFDFPGRSYGNLKKRHKKVKNITRK